MDPGHTVVQTFPYYTGSMGKPKGVEVETIILTVAVA